MNEVSPIDLIGLELKKMFYHLPYGAQNAVRKIMHDVWNLFVPNHTLQTALVQALPEWAPGQPIPLDNVHLECLVKHDIAQWFDQGNITEKERLSQVVPFISYKGYVKVGELAVPFQMDLHITLYDRTAKNPHNIVYAISYDNKRNGRVSTGKDISPSNPLKALDKAIIDSVLTNYNIEDYAFRDDFWRGKIKVNNPADINTLKQDHYNLFRTVKTTNTLPQTALYDEEGSKLYRVITKSPEYIHMVSQEIDMIDEHFDEIEPYIGESINFVDLGAGNGEKIVHMMKKVSYEKDKPVNYIATDSSMHTLLQLGQTKSNVNYYRNINFDLRRNLLEQADEFKNISAKTVTCLWNTLGNYDAAERESYMKKIIDSLNEEESAILSVFLHDDSSADEITAPYKNELSKKFSFRVLEQMGFHTKSITYNPRYDEETHNVLLEWLFTTPQSTSYKDVKIQKNTWDSIVLHQSKRFTPEEINTLVSSQWGEIQAMFSKNNSCMFIVQKKKG